MATPRPHVSSQSDTAYAANQCVIHGKVACEIAPRAIPRRRPEADVIAQRTVSMIVARNGRYLPNSGHDHGRHPRCARIRQSGALAAAEAPVRNLVPDHQANRDGTGGACASSPG
jgi:hypothetical protein